jgi:glyoxylase-like metal-dependent hydrolase (beta-lactamase superfamily II)
MGAITSLKINSGEVSNNIYPVIISDEHEMILIDCGYPGFWPLIKEAATNEGLDISKLTKVIITHHDFDHMGALAQIKRELPNVQIMASIDDEKYISWKEKSLRLQQAEAIYDTLPESEKANAKAFQNMLESVETVKVDVCLQDKDIIDVLGGMEIIATPGHMPGHISLYVKEKQVLIAGDAVVIENGILTIANPQYTLDMDEAKKSIKKLMNYNIDQIICYHGGVYTGDIMKAFDNIVNKD